MLDSLEATLEAAWFVLLIAAVACMLVITLVTTAVFLAWLTS